MSLLVDILAEHIQDTVDDSDTTREEWERAVDQVFGKRTIPAEEQADLTGPVRATWTIDADGDTPAEAALGIWQRVFGRGPAQPTADEAGVFVLEIGERSVEIDLSDERYAPLFG